MKLNLTLRRRIERVEHRNRNRHRKPLPTIIATIHPDELPGPIIGVEGYNGQRVRLKPGESIEQLQRRAIATLPGRMLRTCYRAAPGRVREPIGHPSASTPMIALEAAPWPSVGDPGVGRVASRDELVRMGVIAGPPENFV